MMVPRGSSMHVTASNSHLMRIKHRHHDEEEATSTSL